jgi:hypothetical protein
VLRHATNSFAALAGHRKHIQLEGKARIAVSQLMLDHARRCTYIFNHVLCVRRSTCHPIAPISAASAAGLKCRFISSGDNKLFRASWLRAAFPFPGSTTQQSAIARR